MAQRRSIANIQALFAPGQPNGSITPDRVQDLIQSLRPGFGRISLSGSPQETAISQVNTWVKASVTTELGDGSFTFAMPENNRLQCNCSIPSVLVVDGGVSIQAPPNTTFEIAAAKNGTIDQKSITRLRMGAGGSVESCAINTDFVHAQGDFVELWIRNTTNDNNLTVVGFYLAIQSFVK